MALILLTIVPIIAYWIAYLKGKWLAQVLIGLVSIVIPDVVPLVDEFAMNFISAAGMIRRSLVPLLMRVFLWICVIGIVGAICILWFVE